MAAEGVSGQDNLWRLDLSITSGGEHITLWTDLGSGLFEFTGGGFGLSSLPPIWVEGLTPGDASLHLELAYLDVCGPQSLPQTASDDLSITVIEGDLDVEYSGGGGLPEEDDPDPGAYVFLNTPTSPAGPVELKLRAIDPPSAGGNYVLHFTDGIEVWQNPDATGAVAYASASGSGGTQFPAVVETTLNVTGKTLSSNRLSDSVTLFWTDGNSSVEIDSVAFTVVEVDLATDSDNDNTLDATPAGPDDSIENADDRVGKILPINDDSNGNPPVFADVASGAEADVAEINLAALVNEAVFNDAEDWRLTLTNSSDELFNLWRQDPNDLQGDMLPIDELMGNSWNVDDFPGIVWAESRTGGTTSVKLELEQLSTGLKKSDTTKLSAFFLDLDIDSDNNNDFAFPEGSEWEETLEVHPYGLGKLIMLDSPTRPVTPLVISLPRNLDPETPAIALRIDWDVVGLAGTINLWTTSAIDALRNPAEVSAGGHRVYPSFAYSLDNLLYDPAEGTVVLYAEGIDEKEHLKTLAGVEAWGKPDERVKATLIAGGADLLFDEVKYIVANEDSFFYHLQTRQEVRNELAARGVYSLQDMPNFSLKPLDTPDLQPLDVPDDVILLLGQGSGIAGFQAMLYQDFITGEDEYVLAFAGTDDLNDWIDNIWQGLGIDSNQYNAAMRIADRLAKATPGIPAGNLIITGHSLGGGLASAASVASGIPAHTFNSAGLHSNTLDEQLYQGSTARYNNAAIFIKAYWVDYDILSFVQASVGLMPEAIGSQVPMDGPFDLDMAGNAAALATAFATGQAWAAVLATLNAGLKMVEAHLHPSILYGLLVEESGLGFSLDVLGYDEYF